MRSRVSRAASEALMRSLLLKISLWFVLAMGLVLTTLLLSVAITRLERPFVTRMRATWPLRAQLAATILEHNGPQMLAEYLHTSYAPFAYKHISSPRMARFLGHAAPPSARQLAELAGHTGRMEMQAQAVHGDSPNRQPVPAAVGMC